MIDVLSFCANVYIGTPWILFHPGVVTINNGPIVLLLILVSDVGSHVLW